MMKSFSITNVINPLYTFIAGFLGFFVMFIMFTWNYPLPGDQIGQTFVDTQPFLIWKLLLSVFGCLLTILVVPLWGMLAHLLTNRIYESDTSRKRRTLALLTLQAVFLAIVVLFLDRITSSTQIGFDLNAYVPHGYQTRMAFISIYTFLTALPALLGIVLVHRGAQEVLQKIDKAGKTANKLFPLINEILSFRAILQNYLAILGLVLSMIPINTAGLRAILIVLDSNNGQAFPITYPILYGLIFTLILLLLYIPVHLALSETSRKLRDCLRPLESLESLKPDLELRQALDELLQTNIGIIQNLKAGLIILAPLLASLVSSLLNVSVSP